MILADTSIWIEFLRGKDPFQTQVSMLLEEEKILSVSPIFGELLQGCRNLKEKKVIFSYWQAIPKIPEENLWLEAGEYCFKYNLVDKGIGLIDAVLIVASHRAGSRIWTSDRKLAGILTPKEIYSV